MIAGGIGIAPFRSMIRDALDEDRPPVIELLIGLGIVGERIATDRFEGY
jgi:ferredoxin-NADP reductase